MKYHKMPYLESLSSFTWQGGDPAIAGLATVIRNGGMPNLVTVNLEHSDIGDSVMPTIMHALSKLRHLKQIELHNNPYGDAAFNTMAKWPETVIIKVTYLSLDVMQLTHKGADALVEILGGDVGLQIARFPRLQCLQFNEFTPCALGPEACFNSPSMTADKLLDFVATHQEDSESTDSDDSDM